MTATRQQLAVKESPILFSAPMVRAILEGRKGMTRRIAWEFDFHRKIRKSQPDAPIKWASAVHPANESGFVSWYPGNGPLDGLPLDEFTKKHYAKGVPCPYGKVGEHLWVRETWRTDASLDNKSPRQFSKWPVKYLADGCRLEHGAVYGHTDGKTRVSIFMPRWASRITLEITGVRVERLQSITPQDAIAEGIELVSGDYNRDDLSGCWRDYSGKQHYWNSPIDSFHSLWDSIVSIRAPWESNPWVWVVTFRRIEE